MIPKDHIHSLKKRYPKAWEAYTKDVKVITWASLMEWTKEQGQTSKYYPVAMRKIENKL